MGENKKALNLKSPFSPDRLTAELLEQFKETEAFEEWLEKKGLLEQFRPVFECEEVTLGLLEQCRGLREQFLAERINSEEVICNYPKGFDDEEDFDCLTF